MSLTTHSSAVTAQVSEEEVPFTDKGLHRIVYFLSFLIPVLVMLIIFFSKEIFPFGDRSFLRTDLYHQYAPFTKAMRRILTEGGSFFHTWESGLGTNFLSEYGYYLASPFNWLLILIPESAVIEFITYMVVFKIGLCGLSMSYYLTKHHENRPDFAIVLFSIFYALSGYVAAYSWNIMWMDSIFMFPIVAYALERLVKQNKCFLYVLTLGLSIITNYYIGIMFCIFLPIYFVVQILLLENCHWRDYLKKFINFCLFSLLAGGLAAIILVPVFRALFTTASSSGNFQIDADFEPFFSVFDILSRQLMLTDTHQKLDHWPNIYCGVAVFVMIPFYAMNRNIRSKEKCLYFGLVALFLISFNQEILEFIWHGLHKPNSLPARQSFLYIFVLLCMSYDGWLWLKNASRAQLASAFAFAIGFVILAEKLVTQEELHWYTYYVSILFLILYGILCYIYQHRPLWRQNVALFALCIAMTEGCINMAITSITSVSRSGYTQYDEGFSSVLDEAKEAEGENFYRVERADRRTKNDGAWFDYNSASIFSSAANANLTDLYKKLGMEGSTNSYCMTGSTWLTNMLLDVKYLLSASSITTAGEDMLTLFAQEEQAYLYQYTHSLSLGFLVPSDFNENWLGENSNPIENQNELVSLLTNTTLYEQVYANTDTDTSSSIYVEEAGYYYAYVNKSSNAKTISVSSNSLSKTFDNVNRGYILDLGWHETDDTISLSCEESGPMYVNAYRMNSNSFELIYQTLSQTQMVVDSYTDTSIEAHVTTSEAGLLFTSVPANTGWSVTVDGEEIEYETFGDALIAIPLDTAGSYQISFTYHAPGFSQGVFLTVFSAVLVLILFFLFRYLDAHPELKEKIAGFGKRMAASNETNQPILTDESDNLAPLQQPNQSSSPVTPEPTGAADEIPADTGSRMEDNQL